MSAHGAAIPGAEALPAAQRGQEVLTFRVGARDYAVPASDVAEVFRPPTVTRVPLSPPSLLGLTNLRGKIVPVLSLARMLGEQADGDRNGADVDAGSSHSRVLLLRFEDPVAVAVDSVGVLSRDHGPEAAAPRGKKASSRQQQGTATRLLALEPVIRKAFAGLFSAGARRSAEMSQTREETAAVRMTGFLAFELAGQLYALRLDEVDEVLNVPATIASLPQSEQAALGAFTLRNEILPAISLAGLLGLPRRAVDRAKERMIVARIGEVRIGLVVERIRSILRAAPDTIVPVPAILNRGEGEAQIQSIHRSSDGRGMVSILSAERLFRNETVAALLAQSSQEKPEMTREKQADRRERILVVEIAGETFGLPVDAVVEVMRMPAKLTRVPKAPAFVLGVVNHRGALLPIVDQRGRFGSGADERSARRRVVVTRLGELQVGFIVDGVSQIADLPSQQVQQTPDLTREGARLFDRIATLEGDGRMILLIAPRELLDRTERDVVAALSAGGGSAAGS